MTAITQAAANKKKNNNLYAVGISIAIIVSILLSVSFFLIIADNNGIRSHSNSHIRSRTDNNNNNNMPTMNKVIVSAVLSPLVKQSYKLMKKTKLSHDSFLLRYGLPNNNKERHYLGIDPTIPTCIKIDSPNPAVTIGGVDESTLSDNKKKILHSVLSKSYSPVSHPSQHDYFELVVKSYSTLWKEGGGVGKYLCDMDVGDHITAELKSERIMHGSSQILHRGWKHIGLIAGGTGIAPLLQLARILLESKQQQQQQEGDDESSNEQRLPKIHLLFINHTTNDILGRSEIESLRHKYPDNFFITYSFTRQEKEDEDEDGDKLLEYLVSSKKKSNNNNNNNIQFLYGSRGNVDMAQKALPKPSSSLSSLSDTDTDNNNENTNTNTGDTMIFVCGRDGFVEHWAGPVTRGPPPPGKNKGPKIQGPLLGVLKEAGYDESQVFKY